jgi:hypothetical protein
MFVQFEAVFDLSPFEIPNDDFGDLSGKGVLCAGKILAVFGYLNG